MELKIPAFQGFPINDMEKRQKMTKKYTKLSQLVKISKTLTMTKIAKKIKRSKFICVIWDIRSKSYNPKNPCKVYVIYLSSYGNLQKNPIPKALLLQICFG